MEVSAIYKMNDVLRMKRMMGMMGHKKHCYNPGTQTGSSEKEKDSHKVFAGKGQ